MRALMWFRADLRLGDNPALHEATRRSENGVVAVFVMCPAQWKLHDDAPVKIDFLARNLRALSASLQEVNIALRILTADLFEHVPDALLKFAKSQKCNALFFNDQYEFNEQRRDEQVVDTFENAQIPCFRSTDQCIFEPGAIRTGKGSYYTVFTPFKNNWRNQVATNVRAMAALRSPRRQLQIVGMPDSIPSNPLDTPIANASRDWAAGESAAQTRLTTFIDTRIHAYKRDRDIPSIEGTSMLSPYLTAGVLSVRQCAAAAIEANDGQLDGGHEGIVQWIDELVWREFYKHILVGFPRVSMHRAFKLETERLVWTDNDSQFEAWCHGQTGVPIVDAAMRQLTTTGWMHNRLRMITAMYLSKNLFIDWRRGERFFMQHLIDGDLAANNGGWQWAASTGTDAAPYFRIFNPVSQSKRLDPEGAFIRQFVPELADLDDSEIHDPSCLPSLVRSRLDYPEPLVDLSVSRKKAIDAFKAL